jgi:hypothetical protein
MIDCIPIHQQNLIIHGYLTNILKNKPVRKGNRVHLTGSNYLQNNHITGNIPEKYMEQLLLFN